MDIWGWIVVYAVGLTLLQLLVYRYLLRGRRSPTRRRSVLSSDEWSDDSNRSLPRRERNANANANGDERRGGESAGRRTATSTPDEPRRPQRGIGAADGRYCPHCGAENERDTVFDRCWNCASAL